MTPDERTAAVVRHLESMVAEILAEDGIEVDAVPRAFAELGWDSLSVVELQYRLQRAFGTDLPPEVFEVDDLEELARRLIAELDRRQIWPSALPLDA